MRVREDFRTLAGPEKAAILMLAIGEEHAAKLFALMDDEEIKEISQTMANLGTVSSSLVERLFIDFSEQISATGSLVGSYESTERLLSKVLGKDRVNLIMEEIRGPAGRTMWDKLGNVNEVVLANYLKNEYPQTVAVVLSKIKSDHAARVLSQLPEGFAMEVVMRMLRMEAVNKDVLDDVERTLRTEFMSNLARTNRRDAHELIAEIFNNLDRNTENRFLTALEERNRNSAERIKSLMFTFEDLSKLDPMAVQTVLRNADKEKVPIALKGASDALKDLFFSNMSERAAKIMREEMASMGPVRLREVDEAQGYMVQLAKDLAARGEIVMADNKDDDELVY
ncbi:flagellar motor switch protein FliG [Aliidongia dinghuensis]|uniref:Flagellar motor switch protein FliG n=1 Tax=Aliidongia dinghuensis TaxID=1867774 RepID=A0A8J2YYK7_9PROT|nr:flagellar motor switch protein FliG [Aliidongia dinghuensis]GGF39073.1 flagellar motor switch protein FliG [Aliidongia dinghuensis]